MIEIGFKPSTFTNNIAPPYANTVTSKLIDLTGYGSTIASRVLVAAGMRIKKYWIYGRAATGGVEGTMNVGCYVTDESTNAAGALVHSGAQVKTSIATGAWYSVDVDVDLSSFVGQYIKPAVGNTTLARINYLSVTSGDGEIRTAQNFPNPFSGVATNAIFGCYMEIEEGGPSINPTGTDTDLVNGTSSSLVVQNTVSPPVSITVIYDDGVADPISSVQADFVMGTITSGAGTATFTDTIGNLPYSDGVTYLAADYSYLVTCADDSTFTLDTLTFAPATGRDFVVAVDPVSDATGILYQWESGGPVTGDQIDYQTDAVTVREDFTFLGPAGESGVTLYINYWDSVGQIRYPVTVIVAFDESGEGTVTGLTSVGFTAEGFTVRGFTSRGF